MATSSLWPAPNPRRVLRAYIAIHDTTLGPACGGVRIWPHETEEDAVLDVLRLSKAMTYKSAAAGLPLGGGKAIIIADPANKSEAMLRAYGRFVDTLGGRCITTTDVGSTARDLEFIAMETKHVAGLPERMGGGGDTSVLTGLGVYLGMEGVRQRGVGIRLSIGQSCRFPGFWQGGCPHNRAPSRGRR